ncbi:hypothetical protein [Methylobacterium planeticum]|uniref:Uncharacterized protein n=1 Tax=Methylobacterium planeticum TaxID=2615211 RepID=A0A6N6MX31_9HYPH|nr:hypothetical protein [Methylobacterium planeticum]KAB1075979.1 hypothetical protein F6X51_00055 [Methylobacterium planeticum]
MWQAPALFRPRDAAQAGFDPGQTSERVMSASPTASSASCADERSLDGPAAQDLDRQAVARVIRGVTFALGETYSLSPNEALPEEFDPLIQRLLVGPLSRPRRSPRRKAA